MKFRPFVLACIFAATAQLPTDRDVLTQVQKLVNAQLAPTPTSDYAVRQPPNVPAPPLGVWWTDPTFGSKILRITNGGTTNQSLRTQSAGFCWNADSTRFTVLGMGGESHLYGWDGTKATDLDLIPLSSEVTFSDTDPALAYGIAFRTTEEAVVRSYNLATKQLTDLVGVRDIVPTVDAGGRTYARDVSVSNGKFTFIFGGQSQDRDHYIYAAPLSAPKTGTLLDSSTLPPLAPFLLHGAFIDHSGRYLMLSVRGPDIPAIGAPLIVWDMTAQTFTPLTVSPGGHGVFGFGEYVNNPDDEDSMEYRWRTMVDVKTTRKLVSPYPTPPAFQTASHPSWVTPRLSVVSATYRYLSGVLAPWRAWDDELIEISIDTGLVKRIAHHQSQVTNTMTGADFDYWATPKPAVSPNGKWCLFTSNWRRTLGTNGEGWRQDVFLVQL